VLLKRQGQVWEKDRQIPLTVRKQFTLDDARTLLEAAYSITNESLQPAELWFGVEFNFTLLAGNDPLRYYTIPVQALPCPLNTTGAIQQVARLALHDEWAGLRLTLALAPEAAVWRFPLETLSRSEEGLEKTFQGSTLLAHWKMTLQPGAEKNFLIQLSMHELPKKADDSIYQPSAACAQLKSKKSDS
jgi:alpha-amylase